MKYFLSLAFLFLLLGCVEDGNDTLTTLDLNEERKHIMDLGWEDQRTYYNNLPAERKLALWSQKLDQVIDLDIWNSEQQNLLLQLQRELSLELFKNGSLAEKNFKEKFEPDWSSSARKNFAGQLAGEIVQNLGNLSISSTGNTMKIAIPGGGGSQKEVCECSHFSSYCGFKGWCQSSGSCEFMLSGCGTLWLFACDGMCPKK